MLLSSSTIKTFCAIDNFLRFYVDSQFSHIIVENPPSEVNIL